MRPRLTPHQRRTLECLKRLSNSPLYSDDGWVSWNDCGSRAALDHLFRKGYVNRIVKIGPRGGEHPYYRPETY